MKRETKGLLKERFIMKNSFIESIEETRHELNGKTLKGTGVMMLGGLVTIVGINTMLKGLETMVEASTIDGMLNLIKVIVEESEGD